MGTDAGVSRVGRKSDFDQFWHWQLDEIERMKRAPLFFDLDHTLWDFESNSRRALKLGYDALQLSELECQIATDRIMNEPTIMLGGIPNGRMDKATLRSERFRLALRHLI